MGADLYLEQQYFRPRETLAYVNKAGRIEIYRDYFYYGYKRIPGTYEDNKSTRQLIKSLAGSVKFVNERPK